MSNVIAAIVISSGLVTFAYLLAVAWLWLKRRGRP